MLIRNFDPSDVFVRCRICKKAHPKTDFPTLHRVCGGCADNMNWKINPRNRKQKQQKREH